MKAIKCILLTSAIVLFLGCTTTFRPWKLSDIEEGMDKAQVIQTLGEPDSVELKNGEEFLYYSYREDRTLNIMNNSTREIQDLHIPKDLKETRYVIILLDEKVMNYKEIR